MCFVKVILALAAKKLAGRESGGRKTDKMGAVIVLTSVKGMQRRIWETVLCRGYGRVLNRERWYQIALSLTHPWSLLFQPPTAGHTRRSSPSLSPAFTFP